jgi:hypothetical protein
LFMLEIPPQEPSSFLDKNIRAGHSACNPALVRAAGLLRAARRIPNRGFGTSPPQGDTVSPKIEDGIPSRGGD